VNVHRNVYVILKLMRCELFGTCSYTWSEPLFQGIRILTKVMKHLVRNG